MDVRNVVFPMTAADLVQSAQVLYQFTQAGLPAMRLAEVTGVSLSENEQYLLIELTDLAMTESFELKLKPDTPLLVTGVSRT